MYQINTQKVLQYMVYFPRVPGASKDLSITGKKTLEMGSGRYGTKGLCSKPQRVTKYAVQRELEPGERMREGQRDWESGREEGRDEGEGEQEREGKRPRLLALVGRERLGMGGACFLKGPLDYIHTTCPRGPKCVLSIFTWLTFYFSISF